jgi:hypothetical protein
MESQTGVPAPEEDDYINGGEFLNGGNFVNGRDLELAEGVGL